MRGACIAVAMLVAPSMAEAAEPAPEDAARADAIIAEAREICESFESGEFREGNAIRWIDLDGDGGPEIVVDEGRFACSSAASMYCGSGGCMIHAVIGGDAWSWQVEDWRTADWMGRRMLLLAKDGGWCGGVGAEACFEAVIWSDGRFLTVGPPPEKRR